MPGHVTLLRNPDPPVLAGIAILARDRRFKTKRSFQLEAIAAFLHDGVTAGIGHGRGAVPRCDSCSLVQGSMQIHVTGTAYAVTPQLRAYAEYKVFSRLAPLGRRVQFVQVLLIESSDEGETLCAAAADLGHAGCVRARSRSGFPTAAIDGAADQLARAAAHRLALAAQG